MVGLQAGPLTAEQAPVTDLYFKMFNLLEHWNHILKRLMQILFAFIGKKPAGPAAEPELSITVPVDSGSEMKARSPLRICNIFYVCKMCNTFIIC